MSPTRLKMKSCMMASLFTIGMVGIASAHQSYGGTCTSCHSNTGKTPSEMNWATANLVLSPGDSSSVTFNVTSLGTSGTGTNPRSAISLQGLENGLLNATVAAGGNWTLISESHGTSYNSDILTTLGSYMLNFNIGVNAANGSYPIGVSLAASGGGGSALRTGFNTTPAFTITIVPEPATLTMLLIGTTVVIFGRMRKVECFHDWIDSRALNPHRHNLP